MAEEKLSRLFHEEGVRPGSVASGGSGVGAGRTGLGMGRATSAASLLGTSYGGTSLASTLPLDATDSSLGSMCASPAVTSTTILTTAGRQIPEAGKLRRRLEMARIRMSNAKEHWERLLDRKNGRGKDDA